MKLTEARKIVETSIDEGNRDPSDVAYQAIKEPGFITKPIMDAVDALERELRTVRGQLKNLERLGSAEIEAPAYLKGSVRRAAERVAKAAQDQVDGIDFVVQAVRDRRMI